MGAITGPPHSGGGRAARPGSQRSPLAGRRSGGLPRVPLWRHLGSNLIHARFAGRHPPVEEAGDIRAEGLREADPAWLDGPDSNGVTWIIGDLLRLELRWELRRILDTGSAQWVFPLASRHAAFLTLAEALSRG